MSEKPPAGDSSEVKPKRKKEDKKVTPEVVSKITAARVSEAEAGVALRSLWPGRLVVLEQQVPSGQRYTFSGGGDVVVIRGEDVQTLLARRRKPGCCGAGQTEQPFFELA